MAHVKGKAGKHTTVIDGAEGFVKEVNKVPGIRLAVLKISQTGRSAGGEKIIKMNLETPGSVEITFLWGAQKQLFRIYGDRRHIEKNIKKIVSNLGITMR